jgi:hypothetical protein
MMSFGLRTVPSLKRIEKEILVFAELAENKISEDQNHVPLFALFSILRQRKLKLTLSAC